MTAAARRAALPFFVGMGCEVGRRSVTERGAGVAVGGQFGAGAKLGVGARVDERGWGRKRKGSDDWSVPSERAEVGVESAVLGGSVGSWARVIFSLSKRRDTSVGVMSMEVSSNGAIGVRGRWEVA